MLRFQEQMIQVKGTLKDIENQFKINDIKHESYEERLRKLEAERADYLRSKQI
ncbi:MAG TPA: hypothetical protein VFE50_00670 [Cyclobacteriaceae bacterium]|nr:hypothetical protein [Cyclobacteriaceae bacterium]